MTIMGYSIYVNAIAKDDYMTIYLQSTVAKPIGPDTTFFDWLHRNFPLLKWELDDGSDTDEDEKTEYCQYAAYTDSHEPDAYILATFQAHTIGQ